MTDHLRHQHGEHHHGDAHQDSHAGGAHGGHGGHDQSALPGLAASATLHCLTGCAIGEIAGMVMGAAWGWSNPATIAVSVGLAFVFGFALSSLPLLRSGLGPGQALRVVAAADTLSIATMELVDNLTVALIPGALHAGLVNSTFWLSMMLALLVAFGAAYPVNLWLLRRGRGHALTHEFHARPPAGGVRRFIPDLSSSTLAAAIAAFMLGGLVVSVADDLSRSESHETPRSAGATG